MTANEKWNSLVELYNKNLHAEEKDIQRLWVEYFEDSDFFGYSRVGREVEEHRAIRAATTTVESDVIIKSGGIDLFVIELKRHREPFDVKHRKQLFDYLRLSRNNIGILICKEIYIYVYDFNKDDDEQKYAKIDFAYDNPDGFKFVELFSKATFDKAAVHEFVNQKNESAKNVENIRKELTQKLIMNLLEKYFTDKYGAAEFEQATKDLRILISSNQALDVGPKLSNTTVRSAPEPVGNERVHRGKNEQTVFEALERLRYSDKLSDSLLVQLQSSIYAKQNFKLSTFPFLLTCVKFASSGFDRKRFYEKTFKYDDVEYLVCSQWYEKNLALLKSWLDNMLGENRE